MQFIRSLSLAAVLFGSVSVSSTAFAHDGHNTAAFTGKGQLSPITEKTDAAWLAKARATYPLTTCTVSGDPLEGGDMGKPQEFLYKEAGKPDLFVRFCCKDCIKDFNKEPVKYLKMIEDAEAAKAKAGK
ncbi:MAG: hypothetical protein ABI273_12640 [Lacunisphaera sp.]